MDGAKSASAKPLTYRLAPVGRVSLQSPVNGLTTVLHQSLTFGPPKVPPLWKKGYMPHRRRYFMPFGGYNRWESGGNGLGQESQDGVASSQLASKRISTSEISMLVRFLTQSSDDTCLVR